MRRPWKAKVAASLLVTSGLLRAAVGVGVGVAAAWVGAELVLNTLTDNKPLVKKVIGNPEACNWASEAMKRAGVTLVSSGD